MVVDDAGPLVAVAEHVGATRIVTLDRRHFGVIGLSHAGSFEWLL